MSGADMCRLQSAAIAASQSFVWLPMHRVATPHDTGSAVHAHCANVPMCQSTSCVGLPLQHIPSVGLPLQHSLSTYVRACVSRTCPMYVVGARWVLVRGDDVNHIWLFVRGVALTRLSTKQKLGLVNDKDIVKREPRLNRASSKVHRAVMYCEQFRP
jgi:hypothetical protein